jgi:hypothetical protein
MSGCSEWVAANPMWRSTGVFRCAPMGRKIFAECFEVPATTSGGIITRDTSVNDDGSVGFLQVARAAGLGELSARAWVVG